MASDGVGWLEALFTATSAVCELTTASKLLLCVAMFVGRVGSLSLFVLLVREPATRGCDILRNGFWSDEEEPNCRGDIVTIVGRDEDVTDFKEPR